MLLVHAFYWGILLNCLLCFDCHCRHNVAALFRASILFVGGGWKRLFTSLGHSFMLDLIRVWVWLLHLLLHKLYSAHLKFLYRCHVNLGHIVRFVAWVYVLCNRLCLLEDKWSSIFRGFLVIDGARRRWILDTIKYRPLIIPALPFTCIIKLIPSQVSGWSSSLIII